MLQQIETEEEYLEKQREKTRKKGVLTRLAVGIGISLGIGGGAYLMMKDDEPGKTVAAAKITEHTKNTANVGNHGREETHVNPDGSVTTKQTLESINFANKHNGHNNNIDAAAIQRDFAQRFPSIARTGSTETAEESAEIQKYMEQYKDKGNDPKARAEFFVISDYMQSRRDANPEHSLKETKDIIQMIEAQGDNISPANDKILIRLKEDEKHYETILNRENTSESRQEAPKQEPLKEATPTPPLTQTAPLSQEPSNPLPDAVLQSVSNLSLSPMISSAQHVESIPESPIPVPMAITPSADISHTC